MPTYEYECNKCGVIEIFHSISAAPCEKCPDCGAPVKRLISAGAGILFKGSGFYETDYRSQSYKDGAKKDTSAPESPSVKKTTKKKSSAASKASTGAQKG